MPFRVTSVGGVLGVLLGDGRRVVVKAHQPRESQTTLWTSRLGSNTFCRPWATALAQLDICSRLIASQARQVV